MQLQIMKLNNAIAETMWETKNVKFYTSTQSFKRTSTYTCLSTTRGCFYMLMCFIIPEYMTIIVLEKYQKLPSTLL